MNLKIKNKKIKFLTKFSLILFLLMFLQFLLIGVSVKTTLSNGVIKKKLLSGVLASNDTTNTNATTTKDPNEGKYLRLTDIEWRAESKAGYDKLRKNETDNNGSKISIKREGAFYTFDNGIWAHANSNIYYDISEYSQKYHYLTMYVGLNRTCTQGDGVKFWVYTSNSDTFYSSGQENWITQKNLIDNTLETDLLPGSEAKFVKIDISGAKYLRLQAYQKSGNGSDHSVYVNPMLITDEYKEPENTFPTVEKFDEKIKNYKNKDLSDPNYELLVLQRKFRSNLGNYALQRFIEEDPNNEQTINWLMNDLENLRYYMLGGKPTGSYFSSLTQLTRLLKAYKNDFNITEQISDEGKAILEKKHSNMPTTKGNLYKRMAITLSLTHSSQIALWMQPSAKENQSDAVKRYELYKYMYDNNMFKATDNVNITPWFETYTIEEMRYVMHVALDDEETIWLNEYTQSKINAAPGSAWSLLTPHSYIAYIWPNYSNNIYYSDENYEYFNNLFSVPGKGQLQPDGTRSAKKLYDYGITRGTPNYKLYKLWMNMRNKFNTGAVCGGISKTGHCIRGSHAIPSAVIGQPGHAALIYYTKNANGQGYWGIDNDVSGWTKSEKGERLPLGWGNDRTYVKGYNVPYIALAQEALNDYDSLVKAEELLMTVDTYSDNKQKETIYRNAIKEQSINLDAWAGLVKLYLADNTKTEADYYNLSKEMMESLKCFPFTMYNLANTIKPKFTTNEYKFKYSILETRILTEGKNYQGTEVLQPALTRTLATSILGTLDTSLATFSFDGANAEKIVLSSRFDTSGIRWDYSLDGKKTWKEVSFTANEEHKLKLTSQEIKSITAENDIYVHIVGVNYSDENVYKIDIQESSGLPSTVYANDMENRVIGVNLSTEWRYKETDKWTSYKTSSPNLTGNKTVQLRQGATGTRLASTTPVTYTFTPNNDPDTRKYIPVSHISLHSVSTEATSNGGAAINALDANYNTRWHSAWNGTDTNRFIVVKLDKPVNLSAVEFVPAGGGNGRIVDGTIYGSSDGENWEELTNLKNLSWPKQANSVADAIKYTKNFEIPENKREKTVEYVKIVADKTNGNWFTARAFNFYEDITKKAEENEPLAASIAYSTTEKTNGSVIARLVNPNTNIKITNNDGKSSYIFTENGEFTFTFEDEHGNKGSTTARVTWIDKDIPTADIKYKLSDDQKLSVVLDNINETVYLLDKNNHKTNYVEVKNGKILSVSYMDSNGKTYKIAELDENKVTTKITYTNTTNKVERVKYYVTVFSTSEDGTAKTTRLAYDADRNVINDLTDEELSTLRTLEQTRSNPLEFYIENEEEYEFRLLDLANNITNKYVKINYIDNNTKILASDITYNTTMPTNQNVVATINTCIIAADGKDYEVQIVNNDGNKTYTFEDNGSFTFEYSRVKTEDEKATEESEGTHLDMDIKSHTAKVNWIDKKTPTATIKYNKTEKTSEPVVATLVNESEPIILLNNGANKSYTFTENGEFTFEFQDKAGNIGKAKAKVTWIDKTTTKPDPVDPTPIAKKGDVDGDGEITVNDLAKMKLHFLGLQLLEGKMFENADMNGNNEIDVDDIAQIKIILLNN